MKDPVYTKPYDLNQRLLIPLDITDLLPEDHLARFIADVTMHLNLEILADPNEEGIGPRPYHPRMMFNLLFYGYCIGQRSSRKIEEETYTDLAFRFLAAGYHPDHTTIARFRDVHLENLKRLFVEVLMMAKKTRLVKCGKIALDGTKIKANASLRKTKDYKAIKREYDALGVEVKKLLKAAQKKDQEEDVRYGKDKRGNELPEQLVTKVRRLAELKRVKEEMDAEAKLLAEEKAEAIRKREEEEKQTGKKKRGRKPKTPTEEPDTKTRHNFTDPDSRIMKDMASKAFIQGYNCQNIVDVDSQIVLACDVTQDANDKHQACPMVDLLVEAMNALGMNTPEIKKRLRFLIDAGYFTEDDIRALIENGWDIYISPDGARSKAPEPKLKGRIPNDMSFSDRMRRKVKTKQGKEVYKTRKIVEAPFGQIKEARGIRRFLLRGTNKVKGEWKLINLTHNLLVIHRNGGKLA